jgi:superfamily II DNA/RNA helicase
MTFDELGLSPDLLRAVADAGYTVPTPIQDQAIPLVLQGRDVMGCAQTGTGKTASFVLPMLEILASGRARARMPRSLILTPTRELATQIAENFEIYGKYHKKLSMALLIGGVSFDEQFRKLDRGVDVLIATPGRLLDCFERGKLIMSGVQLLVIDEADRMLDMGFIPDVEKIVGWLPPLRQTLMFSATMPREIRRLAEKFLSNPKEVHVAPPARPAEGVDHSILTVSGRRGEDLFKKKRERLRELIRDYDVKDALIFCNRKKDVDTLGKSLKRHRIDGVGMLHGDMDQGSRTETLRRFKAGEIKFLVASDVAGRGLDIDALSFVVNFDVPTHAEDYVHRIGRTGRAGKKGRAFTLAMKSDGKFVDAIERLIGAAIPPLVMPGETATAAEVAGAESKSAEPESAEPADVEAAEEKPAPKRRSRATSRKSNAADETEAKPRAARGRRRKAAEPEAETPPADGSEEAIPEPATAEPEPATAAPEDDKDAAPEKPAPRGRGRKAKPAEAKEIPAGWGDHIPAFLLER